MSHRVKSKKPFLMTFRRYLCSSLLVYIFGCCCGKRCKCLSKRERELKNLEELTKRLNLELDVHEMVRNQRVGKLLAQINLHKFQRSFVPSFKNYNLNKGDYKRATKLKAKALTTYPIELLI